MDELMPTLCLGPSDTGERFINISNDRPTCLWCAGGHAEVMYLFNAHFRSFSSPLFFFLPLCMSECRLRD